MMEYGLGVAREKVSEYGHGDREQRFPATARTGWVRIGMSEQGLKRACRGAIGLAALVLVGGLAGCSETVTRHGQYFQDSDVAQVQPGMSQEQVRLALGSPNTTSTIKTLPAFYYISSTTKQVSFMKPTEIDRRVVAVYFTPIGTVERVAHYGLKDGKVFDFVRRETPSHAKDEGLIRQLFRNLGNHQIFGGDG